jgi:pimeloyl-ACP methyl ester carboxylesterase
LTSEVRAAVRAAGAIEQGTVWVEHGKLRIAVACWGVSDEQKPPVLLVHGTSFVAEVWSEVAEGLASNHRVYALDRRGHGASHKPALEQYHFVDFALDVCAVIEALQLSNIVGVGHSAGATDLLLAAKRFPLSFSRIFAMEPTIMDPRADRAVGAKLSDERKAFVQRVLRRRAEFDSHAAALERFRAAPAFAAWSETALQAYVRHGLEPLPDGRVRLRCTPEIEAAMLGPIFEAMEQIYDGAGHGDPFHGLSEIRCPVRISTAELSGAIYKEMAARALTLIPTATQWAFAGVGHSVAQEAPTAVLEALDAFARTP